MGVYLAFERGSWAGVHLILRLDINHSYPLRSPYGSRKRIRARTARRDPRQPAPRVDGFCLAVDCLTPGCRGERVYSITALAACHSGKQTVGSVIRLMRCAGRGKPVGAAWLVTGRRLTSASGRAGWRCWERSAAGALGEPPRPGNAGAAHASKLGCPSGRLRCAACWVTWEFHP
jgi:hypothetical protein